MKYLFSYKEPHKHFVDIELTIENIDSDKIYLQLPAWRPGRYELQNFARNIQKFEIFDKKGIKIPFKKISRERWEVNTSSKKSLVIKYNCFCYQMDAGGCWLDEEQLYINFIYCCIYMIGREMESCTAKLEIPKNYTIACGLQKKGTTLTANDYYHLVDSPMIASTDIQHKIYKVKGLNFHIWIKGNVSPDWNTIITDFQKFTEESINVFKEFPEKDYHFLYEIVPFRQYHGVEHRNSTIITLGPSENFNSKSMYESFLGVSCHEMFHAWNALKIRPKELTPYDFTKENYFRTGYVIEGVTTYFGDLILTRSGVFSIEQYFNELNSVLKKHFENFGRFNLSLADSSMDLWIDGYVSGIPNRKVSIYGKGALVALILDLEIRKATRNKKSMDDLMLALWKEFGKKNKGYSEEDYVALAEKIAGTSLKKYFEECIYGIDPIEKKLKKGFEYVGCELLVTDNPLISERKYGFRTIQKDSRCIVDLLEPGSPADQIITKEDEIISIDGVRINNNLNELIGEKKSIEITYGRFGKIFIQIIHSSKKNYLRSYKIRKRENGTAEEKENFRKWLHLPFELNSTQYL